MRNIRLRGSGRFKWWNTTRWALVFTTSTPNLKQLEESHGCKSVLCFPLWHVEVSSQNKSLLQHSRKAANTEVLGKTQNIYFHSLFCLLIVLQVKSAQAEDLGWRDHTEHPLSSLYNHMSTFCKGLVVKEEKTLVQTLPRLKKIGSLGNYNTR